CSNGKQFTGANIDRHIRPAPRVNVQFESDERFNGGSGSNTCNLLITIVLSPNDVFGVKRPHGFQQAGLLVSLSFTLFTGRWVHGEIGQDLQHMILDHIANRARLVVKLSSILDPETLSHRDLNTSYIVTIPYRFQHRVREAGIENVLDRLLTKVVINAKDALLGKILG